VHLGTTCHPQLISFVNDLAAVKTIETAHLNLSYLFVCLLESNFFFKVNFRKVNSRKVNYFLIFSSVMKNKLENTFQYLIMS
jgi:hypothetical protein